MYADAEGEVSRTDFTVQRLALEVVQKPELVGAKSKPSLSLTHILLIAVPSKVWSPVAPLICTSKKDCADALPRTSEQQTLTSRNQPVTI